MLDRFTQFPLPPLLTCSGKTHNAVEALKRAELGVYCSPLRLLALEQYDRLNQVGFLLLSPPLSPSLSLSHLFFVDVDPQLFPTYPSGSLTPRPGCAAA